MMVTKNNFKYEVQTSMKRRFKTIAILSSLMMTLFAYAQTGTNNQADDSKLLDSYIQSKGYGSTISFLPSNIKQFWVDKSVLSHDNCIKISLNKTAAGNWESVPLRIQLANVDASLDCKVEIVSKEKDIAFSVLNDDLKTIGTSSDQPPFVQYNIYSSTFSLEKTQDSSFYLKFISKKAKALLEIKRIILSFSNNEQFVVSPGRIAFFENTIEVREGVVSQEGNSFQATGYYTSFQSTKRIILSNNTINNSITVKNTGNTPTRIYIGYAPYTKDGKNINCTNNLYKGENNILKIVSCENNSKKIVVDSYPKWEKNCVLVLNAKEDFSDFPNFSFIGGTIVNVEKMENGQSTITFDKAITQTIEPGTSVRIQAPKGSTYIYTKSQVLQPGEEAVLQSQIKQDNTLKLYGGLTFCAETYYVRPIFMSFSVDRTKKNTVLVSDYSISY